MKAMAAYDPDGGHLDDWQDEMEARARFYGSRIGVKYAEPFKQSSYLPEKAYFEGKELLVVVDERDNIDYHCVKNGRLHTLAHTTLSYYLQDAAECENS